MSESPSRDYFNDVLSITKALEGMELRIERLRASAGIRAASIDVSRSSGPHSDPTARACEILQQCEVMERVADEYRQRIEDARNTCRGLSLLNPHNPQWGDALELRYCDGLAWPRVAAGLLASKSYVQSKCSAALDWLDKNGLAVAREAWAEVVRGGA